MALQDSGEISANGMALCSTTLDPASATNLTGMLSGGPANSNNSVIFCGAVSVITTVVFHYQRAAITRAKKSWTDWADSCAQLNSAACPV